MVALLNSIDSAVIIDDMSRVDEYFTMLRESGVTSFKEEWKRDESLLEEVLSRIETIWVNPRSVQLFEAESHEQLLASLPAAYAVAPEPFVGFLEAFFHNEKHFARNSSSLR